MMREYLARQPHAPASAEAREKAVQDLLGAFRESRPSSYPSSYRSPCSEFSVAAPVGAAVAFDARPPKSRAQLLR